MNIYLDTGWNLGGTLEECLPEYRMETRRNTGQILDECIPGYRMEPRWNTRCMYT